MKIKMEPKVTPQLCIRCKGRLEGDFLLFCDYWGIYPKIKKSEEPSFECSYGENNQYSIDEWIIQLRDGVFKYHREEDQLTIKIYDWGYEFHSLPKYGYGPFISEKYSGGDIRDEAIRVMVLLLGEKKNCIKVVYANEIEDKK